MAATGTSRSRILILDYGTGNLNSVSRTLKRIGVESVVSSSLDEIERSDKLILPGVGHFSRAMEDLKERGLVDALNEAVLARRIPVLGICLGMELMARRGEEGDATGLGWLDAETIRFEIPEGSKFKVPHMGWNTVSVRKSSTLLSGIDEADEFYFAHSFHLRMHATEDVLCVTDYSTEFPSAVEKDNIFGVQFHPEKSHDAGARLLKNFVDL